MLKSGGVALLVGAGDAIGAAVARRFAEGGYKVCIARREAAKSQALVDELNAAGYDVRAFSTDGMKRAFRICSSKSRGTPVRSRSACSTQGPTSESRSWKPPKGFSFAH